MNLDSFTKQRLVVVGSSLSVRFLVALVGLAVPFVLLLTSCAPSTNSQGVTPTGYEHLDADEREALADLYADEGEQKLGFDTLNEAWGKFSEALKVDPQNKRAEFWREMLKPLLEMKGIAGRVRPLYLSKPNGHARYVSLLNVLERDAAPDFRRFLNEGPADITSDQKFREWMDRLIVSLDTTRTFLKNSKTHTYTLRAPVKFIAGPKPPFEAGGRCTALVLMSSKFSGCAESGMVKFKMNRADLEMIQFVVSLQMLQLAVFQAYNIDMTSAFTDRGGNVSSKDFISKITAGYDGSLFERNRLNLANDVTSDWLAAQQYFVQNQAELCKSGNFSEKNRPGFLGSSGFCMSTSPGSDAMGTLRILEMALIGEPIQVVQSELTEPVSVYPLKIFNQPPREMLSLVPTAFDEEGRGSVYNDTAYSPYFAQGSMTALVTAQRNEDRRLHEEAIKARAEQAALQKEWEERNARYEAERARAEQERRDADASRIAPQPQSRPIPEVDLSKYRDEGRR